MIALTMLLIATIGAGIAGWTAIKQQSSTGLERRLSQAQMMELADRLQLIDQSHSAKALQDRLQRHLDHAKLQRTLADLEKSQPSAVSPSQAGIRELKAQEAILLANVARPILETLPNVIDGSFLVDERRIGLITVSSLQRRGLQASWIETDTGTRTPHIQYREKAWIEAFDKQVLSLALVVVALVLALVLLTLADILGDRRALTRSLYAAAVISAMGAVGSAIWIDPSLLSIIAGMTGVFVVFVAAAGLLGWLHVTAPNEDLLQPQSIDTQGFAGGPVQTQGAARGFPRFLIISIALAALVSSVIGYWYSAASSRGDDGAQEAYQQQLEVVKRAGRASTAVLGTLEAMADLHERRIRCHFARALAQLTRDGRVAASDSVAEHEAQLLCQTLAPGANPDPQARQLIDLDRRFGPQADPRYPMQLQQHVAATTPDASAAEAMALWDGYAELTQFWNAKTTSFLASLTIVAIALYVFGQALSMAQLHVTRAMAACGVAMTVGALGWSIATWIRPFPMGSLAAMTGCPMATHSEPEPPPLDAPETWMKTAAQHYAAGAQPLMAAESEDDFARIIAALECAIAARPNLALAHYDLASAKALSQSAHKGKSYYSLPTKERLDEIERNSRKAIEIQDRLQLAPNSYALNAHAVALWGQGIRDGKIERIGQALRLVERATTIAEDLEADRLKVSTDLKQSLYPWISVLPLLHLNRSLFLIALERPAEAKVAAERALALGAHIDWSLAGTMTTATALLYTHCDRLHDAKRCEAIRGELAAYRRALIEGQWRTPPPAPESSGAQRFAISVSPSEIGFAARIPGFAPGKDRLAVLWSVTDPQWQVLDALTLFPPLVAAGELRTSNNGAIAFQRGALAAANFRRCLAPGHYTAEVLLNGQLVSTLVGDLKGTPMKAARIDPLNLALCHPATWRPWSSATGEPWVADPMVGFIDDFGRPAAFLFSLPMPKTEAKEAAARDAYAIDRALQILINQGAMGGSVDDLRARLKPCAEVGAGGIARAIATAPSGLTHVALLIQDTLDQTPACDIVNSITIMAAPPL